MNEACEGGQTFWNSLYLMNAEFVDEKCAPYQAFYGVNLEKKREQCSRHAECPSIGRVAKAYYLD